jgi:glutamate-1-semialdehyde aminotransferase
VPLPSLGETALVRGRGGRCWDEHGREYIDYVCGYGPVILGHCNEEVNQAAWEQMKRGALLPSLTHPLLDQLGAVFRELYPYAEKYLLNKTGSEAVASAVRLARAFTGRPKVIRCGFHGWHDPVVTPYLAWHEHEPPGPATEVLGVAPADGPPHMICWDGEDPQRLEELVRLHRPEIAALLIDPVQLRPPLDEHLRHLRRLADHEGALLILDESKTGFRVSLCGVQGLYQVWPDLTVLSKALANGFPLAAVLGRAEVVGLARRARLKGTYNYELVGVTAALKVVEILRRPGAIERLEQLGTRLITGINDVLGRNGLIEEVTAVPYRWPCLPYIWFRRHSTRTRELRQSFYERLNERGVLLLSNHMNYVCLAHTDRDLDDTLRAVAGALEC